MTRRKFVPAAAGALALGASAAEVQLPKGSIIELRWLRLRNGPENGRQRTTDFLQKTALPALQRAGVGPIGFFSSSIGPDTPFLLAVVSYASLAAMEQARAKFAADAEYAKGLEAFNSLPGLNYVRIESSLLRAFDAMPTIEPPANDGKRPARLYELRMYESNNSSTLRRKIDMFAKGEIAIFKKLGIQPLFFGETIVGGHQPNLTYMVSYDDWGAREKAWRAFGGDPDWQKMRTTPGWEDAQIVSNISNWLVTPLGFSPIR